MNRTNKLLIILISTMGLSYPNTTGGGMHSVQVEEEQPLPEVTVTVIEEEIEIVYIPSQDSRND